MSGPAANTRLRASLSASLTTPTTATATPVLAPLASVPSVVGTPPLSALLAAARSSPAQNLAAPSPHQQYVDLGKSMGLGGDDLVAFVERRIREEKEVELEAMRIDSDARVRVEELRVRGHGSNDNHLEFESIKLKMPYFDDSDDLESFLGQFERLAKIQNWREETWAIRLGTLLKGKSREVYVGLTDEQANDYITLKKALLTRFQLTAETYRGKFRSSRRESTESFLQYVAKLRLWLKRWLLLSKREEALEGLQDLVILDQLLEGLPTGMATFIREREPSDVGQEASLAQQYLDARQVVKASKAGRRT